MADERDDIRARIDIVELIGQRVALKRAGKHFKGLCPFHQDRNPSFFVDPQSGRYKCWSCGESGDVFTWVMKTQNIDFVDALKELADRAGIVLQNRPQPMNVSLRDTYRSAMNEALTFFREQLPKNSRATDYTTRRDMSEDVLAHWEIGYAPDVGDALASFLKRKGLPLAECKNLFLVDEDSSGGYFDKFRGRVMFPIRDEKGELVAFGGRLLGDGHPKYINSSDTPLYRKSRVLYGMHRAKDAWTKSKQAVLVEGYMDVIACHRGGVTSAVASLGTALSEEQAKLIKRWVDEVVILYDSDEAGQKATERAIDILVSEGLRVRVALMEAGEDPDTVLRKDGPKGLTRSVEEAMKPLDYRFTRLAKRLDPEQPEYWTEAVNLMAHAEGDMELERHLQRLAGQYPGIRDMRAAQDRLRKLVAKSRRQLRETNRPERPQVSKEFMPLSEPLATAEFVVFRSLHMQEFRLVAWSLCRRTDFFVTNTAVQLSKAIVAAFPTSPPVGPTANWIHQIEPEETRQLLSDLLHDFRGENLTEERFADSIEFLRKQAESRDIQRLKQGELTPEQRKEMLERLRKLKPDPRNQKQKEDDDPFS